MLQEPRKHATILIVDMVDYTRLMETDEAGTWAEFKALRRELIDAAVEAHRGRIVKTTGDGVIAEFPIAAKAVACAAEMQRRIERRYADAPSSRRIAFRAGIDAGEVIVDGEDLFGDTVNVAARLEKLSPAGGLCLSRRAFEELDGASELSFEDVGECHVKNLTRPVAALIWRPGVTPPGKPEETTPWRPTVPYFDTTARRPAPRPLPRVDQPSVAVLAFSNMSGEPEQDYFAEGIAEDVTTNLARFSSIFVIARTSAFAYRRAQRDAREIGRELGVDYVVEGSVRKSANRLRVSVQVISVEDGHHVWAERYDRTPEDVFAVQDEIAEAIVAMVAGRVEADRMSRAKRRPTENLQAYDLVLQGLARYKSGHISYEDLADAVALFRRATELDPNYARAHAWLACSSAGLLPGSTPEQMTQLLEEVTARCRRALELDPEEAEAHRIMGALLMHQREFERGALHIERSIALNPNNANITINAAEFHSYAGEPEKADALIRRAVRLNPFHPAWYWQLIGLNRFVAADYAGAIEALEKAEGEGEGFRQIYLAACCAHLGRLEEASRHAARLREIRPRADAERLMLFEPYRRPEDADRLRAGLKLAGALA